MRTRTLVRAVLAALTITAVTATAPAQADEGPVGPEPWLPYETTDFVAPAGRYCDFELSVTAVEDEEEYRVVSRYPDGAVRVYEYRGKLITRFTNVATGESVTRDLSGHAWTEMYPDGVTMRSFTGIGPFGFGFRETDPYPRGYYRLDGLHVITIDEDGTRSMPVAAGDAENVCTALD
ncbi:hypothetical protein [Actinophytocola gossypii]|uniref:Secreted protein n=1 Tax=Actinophytocola gossypii TaxID=2812003 RepID=A0ABT2JAJ3_9PSEU|nr:hypothetical protein [Actinophytocola gossypii]MCT2584778.1 hypothetical protein [Actinophytocola gossypii]